MSWSFFDRTHNRVLHTGIGLVLATMVACVSGCTSQDVADDPQQPGDEVVGEANEAIIDTGIFACTNGGGTIDGELIAPPTGVCVRLNTRTPGVSFKYCIAGACPSCYKLGMDLSCLVIQ